MKVNDIPLREKPSHGAVKRVKRVEVDWFTLKVGWAGILAFMRQGTMKEFKEKLFTENPELLPEFMDLQDSLGEYQTIMLATGWTLKELLDFCEEATEDEYQVLLKKCIEVLGGTAADFFSTSGSGSVCPEKPPEEPETLKNDPSKKS